RMDRALITFRPLLDTQELDVRQAAAPGNARVDDALELFRRYRQRRETVRLAPGSLLAEAHGLRMLAEIERREISERGVDQHVAVLERLALLGGVVTDQDR